MEKQPKETWTEIAERTTKQRLSNTTKVLGTLFVNSPEYAKSASNSFDKLLKDKSRN